MWDMNSISDGVCWTTEFLPVEGWLEEQTRWALVQVILKQASKAGFVIAQTGQCQSPGAHPKH